MPGIDRHSRLVGWLKVALPLAALALLSTLFLVADRIDPEAAIPYAKVDVDALIQNPRLTAPAYSGTTVDGTAINVTAEAARPASATQMAEAEGVRARLEMPDGGETDLVAGSAKLASSLGQLQLSEGVTLSSTSGWTIKTADIAIELDRSGMASATPVTAEGPAGRIEAQGFTLEQKPTDAEGGNSYLLVFSGRVKLLYQPGG